MFSLWMCRSDRQNGHRMWFSHYRMCSLTIECVLLHSVDVQERQAERSAMELIENEEAEKQAQVCTFYRERTHSKVRDDIL
jgi:hypothetical protein